MTGAVTRADWHVSALDPVDHDADPFADDGQDDEYYEALAHGQPVDLDLVARALGPIDLTADAETLFRWGEELLRREKTIAAQDITCSIRGAGGHCLACPLGDQHIAFPAQDVVSVLCRNSRRFELIEAEVDARLAHARK